MLLVKKKSRSRILSLKHSKISKIVETCTQRESFIIETQNAHTNLEVISKPYCRSTSSNFLEISMMSSDWIMIDIMTSVHALVITKSRCRVL